MQDPSDAIVDAMPRSALENVEVDHVLPAPGIGRALSDLVAEPVPERPSARSALLEMEATLDLHGSSEGELRVGDPSSLACPSCGGVLNEVHDGHLLRFRCRVGHAYAPETLHNEQKGALEAALWAALRALEEQAALGRRIATRARERRQVKTATRYDERAEAAEHQARSVWQVLRLGAPPKDETGSD